MLPLASVVGLALVASSSAAAFPDCDGRESRRGTFGPAALSNVTWDGTVFFQKVPQGGGGPFPVLVFMHGSTGQWGMYQDVLDIYATHGFVVVFPFIKGPEEDKRFYTTNTDGKFLLKGIDYARAAHGDSASPLYGKVDISRIVLAGHSMGATCSIAAASKVAPGTIKLFVTQHPGVCGPFGPPPLPSTWMASDLVQANRNAPVIFTTAANDGAFWPAPHTAEHELGCFKGAQAKALPGPAAFVEFAAGSCQRNASFPGGFDDSGHDCPFKPEVETPWVLRALKLYAQLDGDPSSACYSKLWGHGDDSLERSPSVAQSILMRPSAPATTLVV